MKRYGYLLLAAGLLTLTACQSDSKSDADATAQDAANDACGASQYQSYVGKPLSSLSSQRFAAPVRAIPWNAAVTMDFNLHRLNFLADKSGNISKVYCG